MTGEGAGGRLQVAAGLLLLMAAGGAAAASPGGLRAGDPATWVAAALGLVGLGLLSAAAAALLWRRRPAATDPREAIPLVVPWRDQIPIVICLVVAGTIGALLMLLPDPAHRKRVPRSGGAPPPPKAPVVRRGQGSGFDLAPYAAGLVALVLLVFLIWVVVYRLRARRELEDVEVLPVDPLAAAIEAAMLDLGDEADPRRAVIKAYARTEQVLRAHGLPRRPAEAPLEYLDRVLRELGAQAGSVDRLTVLYEDAAFSRHVVGEEMRTEALAAFDGLRRNLTTAGESA